MTVWKYCIVKDHDTIKLVYEIAVKLDTGDEKSCIEIFLNDVMECTVKTQEILSKISEFEEQVKKREEELTEKAMKLSEILNKLMSLGHTVTGEESVVRQPIIISTRCSPY
jgi:predicted ATP-grasp superfamily ATP-dependent carboligase